MLNLLNVSFMSIHVVLINIMWSAFFAYEWKFARVKFTFICDVMAFFSYVD